ncbi:MAG: 30S ribosomal protein S21 [Candidatus Roizmanbacteria bacterium GW2011_GWA2_36_23]|uniref:Small ribosomal subunit protein bS21 n=1 Tax=Candidatus Roizmanbacteria bacterium GW2011_GWA2_36_23 TaxID=1618480 RepID=A0A0G0HD03_9BACT|nr:MAG: 30S ribosomal protein S21 [Candidatus Roizmanbacteria bacterium GW2011_GWA2_36_23]
MVVVTKRKGETKDSIFRKFTRTFIEENIIDDVRKKQFYKKPSILRKEKEKHRFALKKPFKKVNITKT